ncbi:alpha-L-rhamnosidase [Neolewinella lacunae]|uniref:Alpha-L-rhamnosidase n=1 Tax=Neolewinella lacunae TaxID=1517758 RepID=A0A923TF47_9BACT|nr:alpha-L-rhamnosidase [Neolewinella lacunae]MBC6996612.1 alpha-L-rhamnosidase [Neolewinella lacunae]MDN3634824.1 alpha-L-rhamnosidase [Neolewinella lacunae]
MPKLFFLCSLFLLCTCVSAQHEILRSKKEVGNAQLPPVFSSAENAAAHRSPTVKSYLTPNRIVWQSDSTGQFIQNPELLLQKSNGQVAVNDPNRLRLISTADHRPGVLLDFGREIHGGIKIAMGIKPSKDPVRLRIRFGESAMEAMSEIGGQQNATNEHSLRDFQIEVPWLGSIEVGETGFRFVRIDLVDADVNMPLYAVQAAFIYRDLPYLGSFESNDARLNAIWLTGAYTVHLNMQDYLWDGIKRDRLVWVGDLHPEIMTVASVFGNNEVVPRSLDLARDQHPLPQWMNTISSYSMWWLIIHKQWYDNYGDLDYLREQEPYLIALLAQLATFIDEDNAEKLNGGRFLDWPTSPDKAAVHAGLQSMMVLTFEAGSALLTTLEKPELAKNYAAVAARLRKHLPEGNTSKQAAAMMVLAGLADAKATNEEILKKDGVQRMSTFYGYYILEAMAQADDYTGALDVIRNYWGAMLDLGATTFWEDFDINDSRNATPIDALVPLGKDDIHGDFGEFCYVGYRHSFCHGWASGPTAWLSQHVLGITLVEGGDAVKINPHLGDLEFARGTFPTKFGVLKISHERNALGQIKTSLEIPEGLRVIR